MYQKQELRKKRGRPRKSNGENPSPIAKEVNAAKEYAMSIIKMDIQTLKDRAKIYHNNIANLEELVASCERQITAYNIRLTTLEGLSLN